MAGGWGFSGLIIFMKETLRNMPVLFFSWNMLPFINPQFFLFWTEIFPGICRHEPTSCSFLTLKVVRNAPVPPHSGECIAFKLLLLSAIRTHSHSIERLPWWDYDLYCIPSQPSWAWAVSTFQAQSMGPEGSPRMVRIAREHWDLSWPFANLGPEQESNRPQAMSAVICFKWLNLKVNFQSSAGFTWPFS